MKNNLRRIVIILLACACVCSLVACAGGIKTSEAKETIESFLEAVVAEEYEAAEALLHPIKEVDLKAFFLDMEKEEGVDFQKGVTIKRYVGFSSALYDSTVDGAKFTLTMVVEIGGEDADLEVSVVRNEGGYGIYSFDLDA